MIRTVLLVDDEEDVLALLQATLGDDDRYRLLVTSSGKGALAISKGEKPDLILLDILMPDIDGYEVCRAIKSDPAMAGTKVVVLTALVQDHDRRKAMEVGADEYLTKPFSPTALLEKIDAMLALVLHDK